MKKWFLFLSAFMVLMISCEDDPKPTGKYENGVFIVNEGAFLAGNGSITFYNMASEAPEQNIFLNAAGNFAGDVVQSMTFHDDVALIVVNGDSKIEIANSDTFESIETITDELIDKPRYIEVINDKAYISVWGAYDEFFSLVDSYVLVYDLNTKSIATIDTDEGTENLLYTGNRLFAANYNYGSSSTVSAIDPTNNTLIDNIELSAGPAGMVADANGKLWVICVGGYGAENGYLFRINPASLAIEEEIIITGVPGMDLATTLDKQNILYSVGTSVYSLPVSATEEAQEKLFEASEVTSLYALNVDPSTGNIWIGDAPTFSAPGKVYVYSSVGTSLTSFDAGIAPTQIVFK